MQIRLSSALKTAKTSVFKEVLRFFARSHAYEYRIGLTSLHPIAGDVDESARDIGQRA